MWKVADHQNFLQGFTKKSKKGSGFLILVEFKEVRKSLNKITAMTLGEILNRRWM